MTDAADPYAEFRADMRKRHGYCGPYRLGIAVGEAGSDLPAPYTKARAMEQFEAGREVGNQRRRRDEAERNIRIAIWNACRSGGMGQDLSQALVRRAMDEPTMRRVLNEVIQ